MPAASSNTLTLWVRLISKPRQQTLHTDVFIQCIPVNTMNAQFKVFTVYNICIQQPGEPNQGCANGTAI